MISRVKTVFTTHGIPDVVVSDNGRQLLPPVPNNVPDDTDIQVKDPPDNPGDAVELPVDVPAGLNKSAVYTRCGRAVRRPVNFE